MSVQSALDRVWFRWFRNQKGWQEWRGFNIVQWQMERLSKEFARQVHSLEKTLPPDLSLADKYDALFGPKEPEPEPIAGSAPGIIGLYDPKHTPQEQKMAIGKFEIFQGKNKQWFFRLKSPNGKVICQSEGYRAKKSCYKGVAAVRKLAGPATLIEV